MKWIEVEFQGKRQRVPAVRSQGKIWFHWQGETHVLDVNEGSRRSGSERGKTHPGVILAPMPGKITRVLVNTGDKVSRGQQLVVMEAMKMEYTLEADIDGTVSELNAEAGAQAGLGSVLIRIAEGQE